MELSLLQLVAALLVVGCGAFVQGTIGFGMAVVAAPFLYQIEPALVPGPLIFSGMAIGALSARRYASEIDVAILGYALMGRLPGSLLGVFILTLVSGQHLSMVLGGSVLLAVIGSLSPRRLNATPVSLFAAGFCSGVMGTAASIGGPPMALLLQNESGNRIRANLSMFFVVGSLISLVMLAFSGLISLAQLGFGLLLLPAVLIGHKAAARVAERVEKERIRQIMLVLCSVSGLTAIIGAF